MVCPSCGAAADPKDEFCPECHALLAKKAADKPRPRKKQAPARPAPAGKQGVGVAALVYFGVTVFVFGFAVGYWIRGVQAGKSPPQPSAPAMEMGMEGLEGLPPGHPPVDGTPRPAPPLDPSLLGLGTGGDTPRTETEHSSTQRVKEGEP